MRARCGRYDRGRWTTAALGSLVCANTGDRFFSSRRRHTRFDCDWSSDVCSSDLGADQLILPAGARVGIIAMMPTDVTHFHVGKSAQASFMRTYRLTWPSTESVDDPIAAMLKGMGFEPVFLDPTEQLRRQRQSWIVANPLANKLPRPAEEEIQRILDADNLQGLVIVAPGPNLNPESIQGNRLRKL